MKDDTISRQTAIDALIELTIQRDKWDDKEGFAQKRGIDAAICAIEDLPSAERHGRWLMTDAYPHRIYCSNCYGTYALDHWGIWIDGSLPRAYCPNCGAKMDEEENK